MFDELTAYDGITIMTMLALAAVLGPLVATELMGWMDAWESWLLTGCGGEPCLPGDQQAALQYLPGWVMVGHWLVTLALASPWAVELGRRR